MSAAYIRICMGRLWCGDVTDRPAYCSRTAPVSRVLFLIKHRWSSVVG